MTEPTQISGEASESSVAPPDGPLALQLRGITKRFGSLTALDRVDLDLRPGEILGVLGENGAGKSTLMNIVRGLTAPDSGSILIEGRAVALRSANDARERGIGMVHQHFLLVPSFTVADNLVLGAGVSGISLAQVRSRVLKAASEVAGRLNWSLPLDTPVSTLPVGTRQRVEIVRTLLPDPRIILFDEPTAVLGPQEIDDLLRVLAALRDEGRSLVFVSHKLKEVTAVCDRVTVLRRGRLAGTVAIAETSEQDLARRMIGDAEDAAELRAELTPGSETAHTPAAGSETVLTVERLSASGAGSDTPLTDLSFDLRAGEILGIAGVDGNGQTELVEVLSGLRKWQSGGIRASGVSLETLNARTRQEYAIAVIPPDRQKEGLALEMSVADNLVSDSLAQPELRLGPFLRLKKMRELVAGLMAASDIRAGSPGLPARSLSGGNQQKIVIARALRRDPKVIVAASPTRGLDVHATAYVHERLRAQRDRGAGILLISTELDEVLALGDRVAVLYEGRIMGIVPAGTPRETIGLMMGGRPQDA